MKHIPIKLGPLALLLVVISICMTALGILAFTTARADFSMARKYGDTVALRYELESQGQAFLGEAHEALAGGSDSQAALAALEGTETGEDGVVRKVLTKDSFILTVGIVPDEKDGIKIVEWIIRREWEPDSEIGNLWSFEQ